VSHEVGVNRPLLGDAAEAIWDKTQAVFLHVQDIVSIWLRSDTVPSKIQGARLHQVLWAR
jgi:hypothetical protein